MCYPIHTQGIVYTTRTRYFSTCTMHKLIIRKYKSFTLAHNFYRLIVEEGSMSLFLNADKLANEPIIISKELVE